MGRCSDFTHTLTIHVKQGLPIFTTTKIWICQNSELGLVSVTIVKVVMVTITTTIIITTTITTTTMQHGTTNHHCVLQPTITSLGVVGAVELLQQRPPRLDTVVIMVEMAITIITEAIMVTIITITIMETVITMVPIGATTPTTIITMMKDSAQLVLAFFGV
jgi:hypothetical protein